MDAGRPAASRRSAGAPSPAEERDGADRGVPGPSSGLGADVGPDLRARIQSEPWGRALGVEYLELRRGRCRVGLALGPDMVNFQGTPHGGVIFSLADIAFGAACNAHGEAAVALSMTISFLSAARPGTRLIADCRQRRQGRRAGFYDVTVESEDGTAVAFVHCVAHRLPKPG